tara:strand:+ start:388 stop:1575 length:1188 start_codon:yes stop_codon:yes gene_type:complete
MSHNSIINSNRVFLDTGLSSNITSNLSSAISTTSETTINVHSTDNFKQNGVIIVGSEEMYYSSKTSTAFNVSQRGFNGKTATTASNDTVVKQTYSPVNASNTVDKELSGWYTDCLSNDVSLRIGKSDVIQTGIIRYNKDNGVMDGCYSIDIGSNQPHWSSINNIIDLSSNVTTISGVNGSSNVDAQLRAYGDIQTINVETDVTLGQVVKTKLDTSDNKLKVSPCKISITKTTTTQGTDTAFSVSSTPINLVINNKIIFENGSIATLTENASSGSTSLNVSVTGDDVADGEIAFLHKLTDCGNLGIALSTATAGNKVKILTKGICPIKLTNKFIPGLEPLPVKGGIPVGINIDGFGSLQSTSNQYPVLLGNTLHNFDYEANDYQLINFDPKIDYSN